jgi:S-formylglutathione hydrolase FrmB
MPDTGRGFYCDAKVGMAWESSIVGDLIPYIDTLFNTNATRAGRCVGGLSMGGYGAVKLALKYPHRFSSAVSHSGAVAFGHKTLTPNPADPWYVELSRILGDNPMGGPDDPFALAEKLEPSLRPALRIDCGDTDFLLEDNRAFHAHLKAIAYPHEYEEFPGGHTWDYWDLHVQEAIAFHARNLGLKYAL